MKRRRRQRSSPALFSAAIPLGGAIGVIVGGVVGTRFGWRAAFLLVGLPSLGLALLAAGKRLDGFIEAVAHVPSQEVEVGAAGSENALAVRVVGERVEQVLEREIGVAARDRFTERNMEHDLDSGRKHQASSMVARRG